MRFPRILPAGLINALAYAQGPRIDSWTNLFTGLGNPNRDKTMAGAFNLEARLSDPELSALYAQDGIARKIVNVVPREMLRGGFVPTAPDPGLARDIRIRAKDLDVRGTCLDAMIWARLYGGSVVFVGADDGRDPRDRLDTRTIRSLSFLQVYDRRRATPSRWYEDERAPKYGQPSEYLLTAPDGRISWVHESRLVIFRGAHTDPITRRLFASWDYSVLQHPYEAVRAFWTTYKATEHLITDASQAVIKVKNLFGQIASGDLTNLITRAQFLDMTRSVARALLLDADGGESFEKVQNSFAGVAETVDRFNNLLAAVTEIPVTVLMGQAPAGLNATGASDIRTWYDRIEGDRETDLRPTLEHLVQLIALSLGARGVETGVDFKSLWQETPVERATREKTEAETDQIRINSQVLDPEEIRVARFTGKDATIRVKLDPPTPTGIDPATVPGALAGPQKAPPAPPAGGKTGPG